ncbi:HNH endonuclease [Haloarcula halobia]|nr:HNH endonuclease signature motif containing protein [Halomicroarcula sp. XH51]
MLARRGNRCQWCGARGPPRGWAILHVHHIERNPDDVEEDDPKNLAVTCRGCHNWFHHRPMITDAPVPLTHADMQVLLPNDVLLLNVLDEIGPAPFRDVFVRMKVLLSEPAVRERLWVLMGLDRMVAGRDEQLVDQDAKSGAWGFPGDVETSARGYVPDDRALAFQRAEDELVRRALDRGCSREHVASVFDVSRRNTFHKQYRAAAYAFPLDEFSRGGRPVERDEEMSATVREEEDIPDGDLEPVETWGGEPDETNSDVSDLLNGD